MVLGEARRVGSGGKRCGMTVLDPLSIIQIIGGDLNGPNSVLVPGPGHSKADRSLSIKIDPTDPQGFKAHSFSGDDWRTCRDYISAKLGLNHKPQVYRLQPRATAAPSEFALRLWSESISARGTIIETHYLKSRQLELPDQADDALRFHPCCPFGKDTRYPCMIALYRDIRTNEPKAIHRTAVTPDGKKIDRKALGPKAGCAIKLTPDENVTDGLTIAEGIETAIAGMALNFCPTWALGDAGAVAKFPVLQGVECLTILVDNDASGTGQASALECSKRWTGTGCEVFRVVPTSTGTDMADVIRGRAA
jgi:putative DNA primase/helicase